MGEKEDLERVRQRGQDERGWRREKNNILKNKCAKQIPPGVSVKTVKKKHIIKCYEYKMHWFNNFNKVRNSSSLSDICLQLCRIIKYNE